MSNPLNNQPYSEESQRIMDNADLSPNVRAGMENIFAPTAWGQLSQNRYQTVTCPSGQKVKVLPLEMEDIIELNLLNELDTFSGFFDDEEEAKDGEAKTEMDALKALSEGGKFGKFMETMDKVIRRGAAEPKIIGKVHPTEVAAHISKGEVPVDVIPFSDKMTIFSVAFQGLGGMADFREGSGEDMGAVEDQPIAEMPSI